MDQPVCPLCGSDSLSVMYRACVEQGVLNWSRTADGDWHADLYDSAEINFDMGLLDVVLSCNACGETVGHESDDSDTFKLDEQEPA